VAIYNHICEVCGKESLLTPEEAYSAGWDYPPKMGEFGTISPRTCGDCPMNATIWWELVVNKVSAESLSASQKKTIERIMQEPASVIIIK